jgi:hypothetical protein
MHITIAIITISGRKPSKIRVAKNKSKSLFFFQYDEYDFSIKAPNLILVF